MRNPDQLPQYRRLAQIIRKEVLEKRYTDKLPPEREFAQKYEVSYMTARKAIGLLVDQGILLRIHGQGTFVRQPGKAREINAIGLLLPSGAQDGAANAYYSQVIDGTCKKCGDENIGMAVSDSLQTLFDPCHPQRQRMVDGLIVCPNGCSRKDLELVSRFLPVVLIEWDDLRSSCITVDNTTAMQQVIRHLHQLKHTRIAYIGGPDKAGVQSAPARERKEGFIQAMQKYGLSIKTAYMQYGDFEFASGCKAAAKLLSQKNAPTAIVCANDLMAFGAMRCAYEQGLHVPQDLSITGFDDISAADYATPGLTTIAAPKRKLGRLAVKQLLGDTPEKESVRKAILQAQLIIRGSTAEAAN